MRKRSNKDTHPTCELYGSRNVGEKQPPHERPEGMRGGILENNQGKLEKEYGESNQT